MKQLVEIAGIDGSGKTTLALLLQQEMQRRGARSEYASFLQGSDPLIEDVKTLSDTILSSEKERLLGELYSFRFVSRTLKGLEMSDAEWIFIDRYLSSHLVSQQVFGVHLKHLDPLFERLPKPSITLFLDLPVSTAIDRLHSRLDRKSHETYDHLQKAQQIYQRLAKKEHWLTLNALLTPDQLMKEAFNAIYIS